jgi:hypothetical protein
MYSDGCIYTTGSKKYINFSSKDYELVESFRSALRASHSIYQDKTNGGYSLVIYGSELYDDLQRWGVKERKSWEEYSIPSISGALFNHFLRGFFDGDGCAFVSKVGKGKYTYLHLAFTCASYQFLSEIKVVLESEGIFPQPVHKDRNNLRLVIGRQESVRRMVDYLYLDACYFLKRKHEVMRRFYDGQVANSL